MSGNETNEKEIYIFLNYIYIIIYHIIMLVDTHDKDVHDEHIKIY